jgi:hypothetical protein
MSTSRLISLPMMSTARTNSSGDNGSPGASHGDQIGGPGLLLSSTLVFSYKSWIASQPRNLLLKQYCRNTSKRNGRESELKALAKSSLSRARGKFVQQTRGLSDEDEAVE